MPLYLIYALLGISIGMAITIAVLLIKHQTSCNLIRELKFSLTRLSEIIEVNSKQAREDSFQHLTHTNNSIRDSLQSMGQMQKNQLELFGKQISDLTKLNEIKFDNIRKDLSESLHKLQTDNSLKLEKMRETVEEKLHNTLETRLSESFKMVSERLEVVHKGLGEMQTLASGVGDLKKVLTNIKVRGIWGEVQLDSLITQMLTHEQYEKNVLVIPEKSNRVEFAVKLPGKELEKTVWLPIDSKFPIEDFHRLLEAQEKGSLEEVEQYSKLLESSIKSCAKLISEKYIQPPHTTDFAIMFLPVETLYAEAIRRTGLIEYLQREYRIIITSPTTLSAILNSLQMGFKTLVIEKRSSEVWKVLSAVKNEFYKFSDILNKTKLKLDQASKVIGDAEVRTRSIQRKLKNVESLSENDNSGELQDLVEPPIM
ncbi:DNA recombination protein RmuC-like protein [Candidatus Jidaibacter acanthamoeba]|uniref:DNA recombination protein RmuC homolog n=1 Tax=Candidatus Jidaibacter acanthamoebae TaxID=86105 RepID=A0A0C1MTW3_9RICK|nr:DNA recombination protein RmuC [Candidatus Jidaibacter acanthamoeba]KIE05537.1 DNA recombination protein RmuC-like protein [Candidatus Jidaibacter acanthamoeba]